MDCDVAVLGGGPGGYTAAIRAAQLGAKSRLHREGARARRHLPPHRLHPDEGVGADRVRSEGGRGDLRQVRRRRRRGEARLGGRERVEGRRRQADDRRASRSLFKANGVEWVKGDRSLQGREHDRGRGRGGRHVQERDRRHRLVSGAPADRRARLAALRRLDRAARPGQGAGAGSSSSAAGSSAASSPRSSGASAPR